MKSSLNEKVVLLFFKFPSSNIYGIPQFDREYMLGGSCNYNENHLFFLEKLQKFWEIQHIHKDMCRHAQHRQTYTHTHTHTTQNHIQNYRSRYRYTHIHTTETHHKHTQIDTETHTPQKHTTETDTPPHTNTHTTETYYRNTNTHTYTRETHYRNTDIQTHTYTHTLLCICFLKIEKYSLLDREQSLLSCS